MINCSARFIFAASDTSCNVVSGYTVDSLFKKYKMNLFHTVAVYSILKNCLSLHKSQSWVPGYRCSLLHHKTVLLFWCWSVTAHSCCVRTTVRSAPALLPLDSEPHDWGSSIHSTFSLSTVCSSIQHMLPLHLPGTQCTPSMSVIAWVGGGTCCHNLDMARCFHCC
jgi:hypothetical protein